MGIVTQTIEWKFGEDFDKDEHFDKETDANGKVVAYVATWTIVLEYRNNELLISVELVSKNNAIVGGNKARPLMVPLNNQTADYVDLGTVSTRHRKESRVLI